MVIICIIGFLFLIISIMFLCREDNISAYFACFTGTWLMAGSIFSLLETKPSAMDVYQGKTTLEITYKDGVAIDSVVVFKDKK